MGAATTRLSILNGTLPSAEHLQLAVKHERLIEVLAGLLSLSQRFRFPPLVIVLRLCIPPSMHQPIIDRRPNAVPRLSSTRSPEDTTRQSHDSDRRHSVFVHAWTTCSSSRQSPDTRYCRTPMKGGCTNGPLLVTGSFPTNVSCLKEDRPKVLNWELPNGFDCAFFDVHFVLSQQVRSIPYPAERSIGSDCAPTNCRTMVGCSAGRVGFSGSSITIGSIALGRRRSSHGGAFSLINASTYDNLRIR